jgi:hypothetical protein
VKLSRHRNERLELAKLHKKDCTADD